MSATFFAPGIALMRTMGNEKKLPFLCVLHLLPCAILYYLVGSALSTGQAALILVLVLLPMYCMASFYLQANRGWVELLEAIKRTERGAGGAGGGLRHVLRGRGAPAGGPGGPFQDRG